MRGEVLGGWHGHETHPEVSAEGGQVPHFADSGGGVVLAGTVVGKMKTLRQEVTVTVERTTFIAVFPHCACIAISRKACVAFTARGEKTQRLFHLWRSSYLSILFPLHMYLHLNHIE